jgi:hypothetical protein
VPIVRPDVAPNPSQPNRDSVPVPGPPMGTSYLGILRI